MVRLTVLFLFLMCSSLVAQVSAPPEIIEWNILTMTEGQTGWVGPEYIIVSALPVGERTMYLSLAAPLEPSDVVMGELVRIHRTATGFHAVWNKSYGYKWSLTIISEAGLGAYAPLSSFTLEGQ